MSLRRVSLILVGSLLATAVMMSATTSAQAKTLVGVNCSKVGVKGGDGQGRTVVCKKIGKKTVWQLLILSNSHPKPGSTIRANTSTPTNSLTKTPAYDDTKYLYMTRIGDTCSKNGIFGFTGGGLSVCKHGVVRYALPSDIPATPAGGYTSRPAWYPSLAQQSGVLSEPTCSPHSIKFTHSILPMDQFAPIVPYGAMIYDHVTPIDHGYIGIKSLNKAIGDRTEADYVPITAPADGVITELASLGSPTSNRVVIQHGCNLESVYMVINKPSGVLARYANELKTKGYISLKVPIKAGQEFGRQRDNPLDFNIFDGTQWLSGFANPYSYASGDATKPYTADPLPFFTPAIRAVYEKYLQRLVTPRFGKIDYDVIGAASGNWFLNGTIGYSGGLVSDYQQATKEITGGSILGKNMYSWSHLSISPDDVDTSKWIFSTGWWSDPRGDPTQAMLIIADGQPTPDKLTAASGLVVYQLADIGFVAPVGSTPPIPSSMAPWPVGYTLNAGMAKGIVGLQVNPDKTLSVEVNTTMTSPSQFTAFTGAKRIYHH